MFSERFRRPAPIAVLFTVLALLLPVLLACGKRGDPLPPLRDIPLKTSDLKIRQQGRQILLEMTYPAVTINGLALGGIDAVELYQMIRPLGEIDAGELAAGEQETEVAADTTEDEAASAAGEIVEEDLDAEEEAEAAAEENEELEIPTVDPVEFENRSEVLLTLRGAELGNAVTGDRIQIRVSLADELPELPAAHYFAVRTVKADESSDLSNLVSLLPVEPPPAPENLSVVAQADGIELSWESRLEDAVAFDVYRREARERGYGEPLERVDGSQRSLRDGGVIYGRSYIYTVRTVARLDPPLLSAEAGEREIDFEDRFAPALPQNFVALGERGRTRLRWNPSTSTDVAGYALYRREPGREFHRLDDELITGVEYLDRGLTAGFTYDYRIQVVDEKGNESGLSEVVSAEVR